MRLVVSIGAIKENYANHGSSHIKKQFSVVRYDDVNIVLRTRKRTPRSVYTRNDFLRNTTRLR